MNTVSFTLPAAPPNFLLTGLGSLFGTSCPRLPHPRRCCRAVLCPPALLHHPSAPRSLAGAGPSSPPRAATAGTAAPWGPERAACSQAWRAFLRGLAGRLGMSF